MKKNEPVWSRQANTVGSVIEVSVWKNQIELDNKEVIDSYAVSFHRSFKKDGEWQQTQSMRQQDLLPLARLLQKAYDFCSEQS